MAHQRSAGKLESPEHIVLLAVAATPVLITPWINYDPINLPRLAILSTLGFWAISYLLFSNRNKFETKSSKVFITLIIGLGMILISSFVFSGASLSMQFYGAQGRNAGLLTFISLISILLICSKVRLSHIETKLNYAFYFGLLLNLFYSFIQFLGLDPINWQNQYTPVVGTLGNPNFLAAYMAFCSLFLIAQLLYSTKNQTLKIIFDSVLLILSFFIQAQTKSIQGILMVALGIFVLLYVKLRIPTYRRFSRLIMAVTLILGLVLTISFLGKGPFGESLYQSTLKLRTFFWDAAFQMALSRPITGFGIDRFGEWYRTFRSQEVVDQFGAGIVTDSAHSIYFDILSGAGFLALIFLILIQGYIIQKARRMVSNSEKSTKVEAFVLAAWIAFLAQSVISVNSLAISTLGFCLGGLIVGMCAQDEKKLTRRENKSRFLVGISGASVGILLVVPLFLSDANFRKVISQTDGQKMVAFADSKFINDFQILVIAKLFYSSGYSDLGRAMTNKSLEINPRNVNALMTLLEDPSLKKSEKVLVIQKLRTIDPHNKGFQDLRA